MNKPTTAEIRELVAEWSKINPHESSAIYPLYIACKTLLERLEAAEATIKQNGLDEIGMKFLDWARDDNVTKAIKIADLEITINAIGECKRYARLIDVDRQEAVILATDVDALLENHNG